MNVIWIVADSLRYDHVGANGNTWIKTPNLDRFAARSLSFDRAFQLSNPTIPTRTDMFTGRYTFPRRGWTPLQPEDVTIAERLTELGMTTQMFFDTYHLRRGEHNFDRGFQGWEWIRGQEGDHYLPAQPREEIVLHPTRPEVRLHPLDGVARNFSNARFRRFEADYISPRTYTAAEQWLEYHYDKGPFFLYVDSFDPHEPWDPPAYYAELYDPDYGGEVIAFPRTYCFTDDIPDELIRKARALYAGEVTMVDRWMGRLLQKIEDLRLFESSIVIVMSDHGFLLGEHGRLGKANRNGAKLLAETGDPRYHHPWPYFREINQIMLMIRIPGIAEGGRTDAIVQPVDLLPTILAWLEVAIDPAIEGESFLSVLSGERTSHRDLAITSSELMVDQSSTRAMTTVTDGRWQLHFSTRPGETELHDLETDPGQTTDILQDHPDVAEDLHRRFLQVVRDKVNERRKLALIERLPEGRQRS
jgi:arylsulfatase A-like enzyme